MKTIVDIGTSKDEVISVTLEFSTVQEALEYFSLEGFIVRVLAANQEKEKHGHPAKGDLNYILLKHYAGALDSHNKRIFDAIQNLLDWTNSPDETTWGKFAYAVNELDGMFEVKP